MSITSRDRTTRVGEPRIDPVQLLKCLSVLLSPSGGIKSKDEVQRLASLMTKFSKKLVSKCIYIQILKRTETELLGSFMGAGGWNLVHLWLTDGMIAKNWPLIQELLELLLLCPVDVERLKSNNCPKLVKELSKEDAQAVIQVLAAKLVEQWLKLVKGEAAPPLVLDELPYLVANENMVISDEISNIQLEIEANDGDLKAKCIDLDLDSKPEVNAESNKKSAELSDNENKNQIPILKISVKDGKQVVSKLPEKKDSHRRHSDSDRKSRPSVDGDSDKKESDRKSDSSRSSSSSSKSSKHRHSRSSSSGDHRHSSSKSRHSSSSSSKDSDKHKDKKSSDKDRISEKSKESSSDKSKDSTKKTSSDKSKPPSIMKLGKIPKKSSSDRDKEKSDDAKKEKLSISIEVRKPCDDRPKTVKTFNSKFRSHGLEEEAKPPPPRGVVKKPTTTSAPLIGAMVPKRPSPIRITDAPPEKRVKLAEGNERPGAIKLIPPKPKPSYLLESGSFMDALAASATNKKEPRKRKRRMSGSKENTSLNEASPPSSPNASGSSLPSTPQEESKPAPLRFYQDTLDTEDDDKEKNTIKSPTSEDKPADTTVSPLSPSKIDKEEQDPATDESVPECEIENDAASTGLKGVLCVHKKKGPKKSLRWRDSNLEDVKYFELDETERVNVTKTFLDMKQMEHSNEREAMKKGRDMESEDTMEEKMSWRKLTPIDINTDVVVEYGKNSKEKLIQSKRHACVLQALYFHKSMIPDSPAEADFESHPGSDPTVIPLDDVNGNPDSVNDFQNTPWPEPKINANSPAPMHGQQMFPQMPPFNPGFNGPPFGMPGFPPGPGMMPNGPPPDWQMNGPNMMMHPEGMSMNPDMFMGPPGPGMGPGPMFNGPMGDFNMMDPSMNGPNMNGPNMNGPNFQPGFMGPNGPMMNRPMGPGGPPAGGGPPGPYFNNRGGMRGGPPTRGGPNMWRSNGNWNGPHRGGVNKMRGKGGRVCAHYMKRGSCRDGDSCSFLHPR